MFVGYGKSLFIGYGISMFMDLPYDTRSYIRLLYIVQRT